MGNGLFKGAYPAILDSPFLRKQKFMRALRRRILGSASASGGLACENFTSYTEVDTINDRIQRAMYHVDHYATLNESTYVYKDKTADFFNSNWTHKVDVYYDAGEITGQAYFWMLSNHIGNVKALYDATRTFITLQWTQRVTAPIRPIIIREFGVFQEQRTTTSFLLDTWYYLLIKKVGTAFSCKIYDTAESRDAETADAHLLETISLTLNADHKFRYIFVCNTWNDGVANKDIIHDIGCLNLG